MLVRFWKSCPECLPLSTERAMLWYGYQSAVGDLSNFFRFRS